MELAELIFSEVRTAGFDEVGCLPIDDGGDPRYAEWIARGYHGEMGYLERHAAAKQAPAAAFAEFRTIVVCALEYGDVAATPERPSTGNLSRYALGDDYHDVMKKRLFAAADRLRNAVPDLATRAFVDTGPLNEKLIAAAAGLGWVGKHTNLIDPGRGSYFFLGLLLVSAELPSTGPAMPDRCGSCDACIPACPTGAIVAPYVLDARRCIAYLTIELRGSIPRELRSSIGHRIFGCDDCQEVCPWNRFARATPPEPFAPRPGARDTSLEDWLALDVDAWRLRFRRSAVKRAGYAGFLRNVLTAAGCAADPELARSVTPFLRHDDPMLREHAAWALGRLLAAEASDLLRDALRSEDAEPVRFEIAATLDELASGPQAGKKDEII